MDNPVEILKRCRDRNDEWFLNLFKSYFDSLDYKGKTNLILNELVPDGIKDDIYRESDEITKINLLENAGYWDYESSLEKEGKTYLKKFKEYGDLFDLEEFASISHDERIVWLSLRGSGLYAGSDVLKAIMEQAPTEWATEKQKAELVIALCTNKEFVESSYTWKCPEVDSYSSQENLNEYIWKEIAKWEDVNGGQFAKGSVYRNIYLSDDHLLLDTFKKEKSMVSKSAIVEGVSGRVTFEWISEFPKDEYLYQYVGDVNQIEINTLTGIQLSLLSLNKYIKDSAYLKKIMCSGKLNPYDIEYIKERIEKMEEKVPEENFEDYKYSEKKHLIDHYQVVDFVIKRNEGIRDEISKKITEAQERMQSYVDESLVASMGLILKVISRASIVIVVALILLFISIKGFI